MAAPFADTLRALVETVESNAAPGEATPDWLESMLARRPERAIERATAEFAIHSESTTPLWRRVPSGVETARGGTTTATMSGATGLATTLGIPIVAAIGSWMMLGAGYYQARKEVRRPGFMSGFSRGFTMGVLQWTWDQAVHRFAKRFVIRKNTLGPVMDRDEALSYNEGLIKGWAAGSAVPETFFDALSLKPYDTKKGYRIALRRLANRHDSGPWSTNEHMARLQQIGYVIELAAAGLRHGLIVPE